MDFGFVGPAYEAQSITQDAQQTINWYPEVDPTKNSGSQKDGVAGDRGVVALYPTPGLVNRVQPRIAPVRGLYTLSDGSSCIAVVGNSVYRIGGNYVPNMVGTLGTSAGLVSITDNGTSAYITDGTRYSLQLSTNILRVRTDGAFNGGSMCAEMDNYIIYNRPGTSQWGCTDASSAISSALNLGEKLSASDPIVAIYADHREVKLLGSRTSEVWIDAGTFPFPFQILAGTTFQHGIISASSLSRLGESFAFLARDDRGNAVVVQMSGYSPTRISNHAIENDIQQGVLSDAIGMTYQQNGHEFYMLTLPTQDKTWVYDLATGQWHRRGWRSSDGVLHRHRANCIANFNGEIIVGDWENGKIYAMDITHYTDDGAAILRRRRSPHITNQLMRVFHHSFQVQFQPGVANGDCENPLAMFRWSDDGGFTWSNEYFVPIGKVGEFKNRAIKRQLGAARDRVYEVSITDPVFAAIVSADLQVSAGAA